MLTKAALALCCLCVPTQCQLAKATGSARRRSGCPSAGKVLQAGTGEVVNGILVDAVVEAEGAT